MDGSSICHNGVFKRYAITVNNHGLVPPYHIHSYSYTYISYTKTKNSNKKIICRT